MARRRNNGTISVYTDVEIDVGDVVSELTNDDLLEEFSNRKMAVPQDTQELLTEALIRLRAKDFTEVEVLLERLLFPKYPSLAACEERLKEIREGKS